MEALVFWVVACLAVGVAEANERSLLLFGRNFELLSYSVYIKKPRKPYLFKNGNEASVVYDFGETCFKHIFRELFINKNPKRN